MNDPYAAFSQNSQTNATMSTPVAVTTQSVAPSEAQVSATDRLEELLRQLQEEQIAPPTPAAAPAQSDASSKQDFISALSRVPTPPTQSEPDQETPTVLNSLDGVIKTIGEQFEMGQPSLSELLELAKKSGAAASAAQVTPATTPTLLGDSPMQFARPQQDIPTTEPTPSWSPKVTVMPPATEESKPLPDLTLPVMNEMPIAPIPTVVSAPPVTPAPADATVSPIVADKPVEATIQKPKRRILSQYLQNLAGHLKQHGQLNLPSYSKLVAVR
jgi:hypothetical protein